MSSTRTGRIVRLDRRSRIALTQWGRDEDDAYLVAETPEGTVVLTPAEGWTDAHADFLSRPDVQELLRPGSGPPVEAGADPTPDCAAERLACLALRQAGVWGEPYFDVDVDHPRFDEAVEAAAAAADEPTAFEAARAVLEGPEAFKPFDSAAATAAPPDPALRPR